MVNPIIVGVAALLIFCTLTLSAPTGLGDEDIARMVKSLTAMRHYAVQAGIAGKAPSKDLAIAIAVGKDPTEAILREMNIIVETKLPKNCPCTIDQLLSLPEFKAMDQGQIRIARAYHACLFDKLKCLFMYIHSSVKNKNSKRRGKLLAGLVLVWDFLALYYILEKRYLQHCDIPGNCKELELPIYETFSSCLDQQHVSELCREISLSFGNLRRIEELRIYFEREIAKLQGAYGMARFYDTPMDYILNMINQFESLGHTRPWSGVWDYEALSQIHPMERDALPIRLAHEYCIVRRARCERARLLHHLKGVAPGASGVLRRLSGLEALIKHHHDLFQGYRQALSRDREVAQQDYNKANQPNAHGDDESFPPMTELTDDVDKSNPNPDNSIAKNQSPKQT
ncbi:hypothetical protein SeLEV6574_g07117 [Synchytrium endobioticum]|uniref:Uncharacterized protein n=1 Tax=Synchytrium endobioticum TaxID=286115 RepID=A0A507CJ21_9FUNG|nr:hypothetical protein SeLEV6574_g07117 [Synchytrium endobioticum]